MKPPLPLRESPVPVFIALVALLVFVQVLHIQVIDRESSPVVVRVPEQPPPAGLFGDGIPADDGAEAVEPDPGAGAGPLHEEARRLARQGERVEALERLDRSLASEGSRDSVRLQERAILLLKLGRPAEAIEDILEAGRRGGGSPSLYYNLGLARARTGDAAGAEAAYREALGENPQFDEAWNNLGFLLERRGDRAGALEAMRRAVDLAQPSVRYRPAINLARLLERDGSAAEAVAVLESAIGFAPGETAPRIALGDILAASPATVSRARKTFEDLIRLAPADPEGHYHLGLLEAQQGDRAAAVQQYQEALRKQPGFKKARHALASQYLDMGRPEEALRHFEVLRDQGSDPRASFGLGRARRALGDFAGAASAYREAVRLSGGRYPEALFNLGILLAETGDRNEAESAYREALAQDPGYAAAWMNLSLLLSDMGRPDEALDAAERALLAEPGSAKAWFMKGHLLSGTGRREEALSAYREAVRLNPRYTKAMINAAILNAAAGQDGEAVRLYREALAIDPRNASAWYNLGLALHRAGRDDEARDASEKAVAADPEATRAAQNLGVLLAREGRVDEARRVFAGALERKPDNVALRYNLVLQLEKLGRSDEALREIRRVVNLDPDHARAFRVMARLLEAKGENEEADRARARARVIVRRTGEAEEDQ